MRQERLAIDAVDVMKLGRSRIHGARAFWALDVVRVDGIRKLCTTKGTGGNGKLVLFGKSVRHWEDVKG